jgi:hypothetical protein
MPTEDCVESKSKSYSVYLFFGHIDFLFNELFSE